MHWDHVIGIPFFRPIFTKGYKLNIYHIHDKSPEFVKLNFNGINFPILWNDLESEIHFHKMTPYKETKLGDMSITPFTLDHPGHSYGYRVESKGKSVAIGFDSEYSRMSKEDMGDDLKYYQNLDLLIFDGQYNKEELKARKGWGHSTPTIGTEIALREGIKNIAFTHHDPWSKKDKLQSMHQDAENYKKANMGKYKSNWSKQPEGPNLIYAYDQLDIKV